MQDKFTVFQMKKHWDTLYNKGKKPSYKNTLGAVHVLIIYVGVLAVLLGIVAAAMWPSWRGDPVYVRYQGNYYRGYSGHPRSELPDGYQLAEEVSRAGDDFWNSESGTAEVLTNFVDVGEVYTKQRSTKIYFSVRNVDGENCYFPCRPYS